MGLLSRFMSFAQGDAPEPKVNTSGKANTGAQVVHGIGGEQLVPPMKASYECYRLMRKHPTIALARLLTIAPVVAASWTVEADDDAPDEAKAFIEKELLPIREPLVQRAMEGGCDFGWQPFEKVFHVRRDGRIGLRKLKALLHELTEILIERDTGDFAGFRQPSVRLNALGGVVLEPPYCFLVSFRVEGTQWYGEALLENVRDTWNAWREAEAQAAAYDKKVAGARWAVKYPPGSSPTSNAEGAAEVDNSELAAQLVSLLKAGTSVIIPRRIEDLPTDANGTIRDAWSIDFLSDPVPRQSSFVEREKKLEADMVRGLIMPERAILEGQFGTKAEASSHADLAVTQRDLEHRHITRLVNAYIVDQLIALNFGEDAVGKVRLVANPIADDKAAFFQELYKALIGNPTAALELLSRLDFDWISQAVGVRVSTQPNDLLSPDLINPADPSNAPGTDPLGKDGGNALAAARGV